ncbi:four helix bundle protein [Fibrobacter sp.]|uniref:four helix bundle protein n=1 Tax=Fibrobacter sp. TaxID=35828 RepID=UPI00388E0FC9
MTNEEKTRFRSEMEERTLKFAADVAMLLKRFGGDENRNTRHQLAKSSTSIGANYREANRAETVPDFLHKIGIVLKEADETLFWLGFVLSLDPEIEDGQRLCDESLELVKIFQSIKTKTRAYLREKGELRC